MCCVRHALCNPRLEVKGLSAYPMLQARVPLGQAQSAHRDKGARIGTACRGPTPALVHVLTLSTHTAIRPCTPVLPCNASPAGVCRPDLKPLPLVLPLPLPESESLPEPEPRPEHVSEHESGPKPECESEPEPIPECKPECKHDRSRRSNQLVHLFTYIHDRSRRSNQLVHFLGRKTSPTTATRAGLRGALQGCTATPVSRDRPVTGLRGHRTMVCITTTSTRPRDQTHLLELYTEMGARITLWGCSCLQMGTKQGHMAQKQGIRRN